MNKTPPNELAINRSAYRRRPRADRGKAHKLQVSPEYWAYLSRHKQGRKLSEAEVLAILDNKCDLCGEPATHVRGRIGYCPQCDKHMGLGPEHEVLAWVRRVYAYRL
jgi:hypothetical protein